MLWKEVTLMALIIIVEYEKAIKTLRQ